MRQVLVLLLLTLAASCGSAPPAVPKPDGGLPDGGVAAEPLSTPAGQWTWVPFPETRCANGTPAGIGLNPAPGGSRQVFVFMVGGGACWDAFTCYVLKTASHIEDTYTQALLASEVSPLTASGLMDRQDPTSPFRAAHFVYVPYCTGDLHAGDSVRNYDGLNPQRQLHHRGASNMDAFLLRLKATFPDAEQVWLTGSSAGGYGAQLNFDRVARTFSQAHVDLLADSAQAVTPYGGRWPEMTNAWNLRFPEGCTECPQRVPALIDTLAARWPGSRLGLLAYDNDLTLTTFFNYPLGELLGSTNSLLANQYAHEKTRYFVLPGTDHVLLGNYKTLVGPGGVSLKTWVRQWALGEPGWSNVR